MKIITWKHSLIRRNSETVIPVKEIRKRLATISSAVKQMHQQTWIRVPSDDHGVKMTVMSVSPWSSSVAVLSTSLCLWSDCSIWLIWDGSIPLSPLTWPSLSMPEGWRSNLWRETMESSSSMRWLLVNRRLVALRPMTFLLFWNWFTHLPREWHHETNTIRFTVNYILKLNIVCHWLRLSDQSSCLSAS